MKTTLIAIRFFIALSLLCGVVYPLLVTGASQLFFKHKAEGSLITDGDKILGSEFLGQNFTNPKYFWARPSAIDYNPLPSGGSNLGPTSADLAAKFKERKQKLQESSEMENAHIPADLLFASGSGLDPHMSPEAAHYQVERIGKSRGFKVKDLAEIRSLIDQMTGERTFGIIGEKRVNVLQLNLELERRFPQS